ncbi:MAG: threonine ammonia-lyase [Aridibacter sp.]
MTIKISDIEKAKNILKAVITQTPILPDKKLSETIGTNVFVKAECLQRGGSFKIRGAFNKISRLTDDEKKRGVVAASAGNHAQGVALAASLNGIRSTIVLPEFAPLTKVMATKNYGAEVILQGSSFDEAMNYSFELAKKHGYTHIHAFDDELIIAGQGTIGLEIKDDLPNVNAVVVPIGGGGIISGIAIAIKTFLPKTRIIGIEAKNFAVIKDSLETGSPVAEKLKSTIADGIAVKSPGKITLEIIREYVDEIVEVTEEEIANAIFHCIANNRLVVEGAGAAGVAALLANKIDVAEDETVCAVLCGGNIDANLLARILEQVLVRQSRYITLKVLVQDRPGRLAALLNAVSAKGANVIEVFHRRAMYLAPLGQVGIEMLLEVRDGEHGNEIYNELQESGYQVAREEPGEWDE